MINIGRQALLTAVCILEDPHACSPAGLTTCGVARACHCHAAQLSRREIC